MELGAQERGRRGPEGSRVIQRLGRGARWLTSDSREDSGGRGVSHLGFWVSVGAIKGGRKGSEAAVWRGKLHLGHKCKRQVGRPRERVWEGAEQ